MIGTKVNARFKEDKISGTVTHTDESGNIYIDTGNNITKIVRVEHIETVPSIEIPPKARLKKVKP